MKLSSREWQLYDMGQEAYDTAVELTGTFDLERSNGDGTSSISEIINRCADGDLDAHEEVLWFNGSILGACNNI